MRTLPIYTGGFVRPTIYHGPLPRIKPQSEHVSMLIKKRMRARERRLSLKTQLLDDLNDLRLESKFEEGLRKLNTVDLPSFFFARSSFRRVELGTSSVSSELSTEKTIDSSTH